MLKPFKKTATMLIGAASLSSISLHASAACSRDDIEYYLSKGFSPDQITTLCSSSTTNKSDNIEQQSDKSAGPPAATISKTDDTQLFLMEAIKGRNIVLSNNMLVYTRKVCLNYGEEDMFGFAPRACPNVMFKINLNELKVIEPKTQLFFNPDSIEVEGHITREIIDGLEKHTAEEQVLISSLVESGNKTEIPIRDDISIDKAYRLLDKLAN